MNQLNQFSSRLLRSPILWGALLTVGFYAPIEGGYLTNEYLVRYLAGHWMEYVEVSLFFVGFSALMIKLVDIRSQFGILGQPLLGPVPHGGLPVNECQPALDQLAQLPTGWQSSYLVRRLREILLSIQRKNSTETLDTDIKYQSDLDAGRAAHGYGFVRIIIWALPILGLLGTVIGITLVIANLSPQHLEESLPKVTEGLGVAFDTTAVALGLSMVLMFMQYFVDRHENHLLSLVDDRVNIELLGRFQSTQPIANDPNTAALQRVATALMQSTEMLISRQAEIWHSTIDAAHDRWQSLTSDAGDSLTTSLSSALEHSLRAHADQMTSAEQVSAEHTHRHFSELTQALVRTAESSTLQQQELTKQTEVLLKVVEATGQIAALEQTLNRNLQALSGAKNFEETVVSLAAAVQLLSARMQGSGELRQIELPRTKRSGQAA